MSISSPWFAGPAEITQGYRPGAGAYEPEHTGIDVGLSWGTPVVAALPGQLEELEDPSGFGTYEILHPDSAPGIEFILGHLAEFLGGPRHVSAGEQIGLSGSSGWSTGPHLHFQEQVDAPRRGFGGRDVNPYDALTTGAPAQVGGSPVGDAVGTGVHKVGDLFSWLGGTAHEAVGVPDAVGKGLAGAGVAIGSGIVKAGQTVVDSTAQHISNAVKGEVDATRTFLSKQMVALIVASVVVLILFL